MRKLTHSDLVKFGRDLGYDMPEGVCAGISGMLMEDELCDDGSTIWNPVKMIESGKEDDFSTLIKEITSLKNIPENLHKPKLVEIQSLYRGLNLYLQPYLFPKCFDGQRLSQSDLDQIYRVTTLTRPARKNDSITVAMNKSYAFTADTLSEYIRDLGKAIGEHKGIPILLRSSNHSVFLKYQPEINPQKPWKYVDVGDFKRFPKQSKYYRELDDTKLVSSLFVSFNNKPWKPGMSVVLTTTVIVGNTHLMDKDYCLGDRLNELDSKYKIDADTVNIYDHFDASLLYIASRIGDYKTVCSVLDQKNVDINKKHRIGASALFIACHEGHGNVATALIKNKADTNIIMDGFTPLLLVCGAPNMQNKEQVLNLLLEHGANIQFKNNRGKTAFDILWQKNNRTAMATLLRHANKQGLPEQSIMSAEVYQKLLDKLEAKAAISRNNSRFFADPGNKEKVSPKTNTAQPEKSGSLDKLDNANFTYR